MSPSKIIIGATFYGRIWETVADTNSGLYQPGKFLKSVAYINFSSQLSAGSGFVYYWDSTTIVPYLYNARKNWCVTYDDNRSIRLKTQYAINKKLGGILFWELTNNLYSHGLLYTIDSTRKFAVK